jgi:hypothetical protein
MMSREFTYRNLLVKVVLVWVAIAHLFSSGSAKTVRCLTPTKPEALSFVRRAVLRDGYGRIKEVLRATLLDLSDRNVAFDRSWTKQSADTTISLGTSTLTLVHSTTAMSVFQIREHLTPSWECSPTSNVLPLAVKFPIPRSLTLEEVGRPKEFTTSLSKDNVLVGSLYSERSAVGAYLVAPDNGHVGGHGGGRNGEDDEAYHRLSGRQLKP